MQLSKQPKQCFASCVANRNIGELTGFELLLLGEDPYNMLEAASYLESLADGTNERGPALPIQALLPQKVGKEISPIMLNVKFNVLANALFFLHC